MDFGSARKLLILLTSARRLTELVYQHPARMDKTCYHLSPSSTTEISEKLQPSLRWGMVKPQSECVTICINLGVYPWLSFILMSNYNCQHVG